MGAYAAIDKCGCVTAIASDTMLAKHLGPVLVGMSRWATEVRRVSREQAVGALCPVTHTRKGCPHPNACPTIGELSVLPQAEAKGATP